LQLARLPSRCFRTTRSSADLFRTVTAIALLAFRNAAIDLAILETGLGGASTPPLPQRNIVAITQIALDHQEYLGNTIASIAAEKSRDHSSRRAGRDRKTAISRSIGCLASSGCKNRRTPILVDSITEPITLALRGRHQLENAAVAIHLAELLRQTLISLSCHRARPRNRAAPASWNSFHTGRRFLIDGAHNPAGANRCARISTIRASPADVGFWSNA
jgi:folylpolyglutamate synthase/dihydropteroate synthase